MASLSYMHITAIVFLIIGFVVYLPVVIYLSYPLFRARNALIFQKRHIDLTLYAIYALLINIIMISIQQLMIWGVAPFQTLHYNQWGKLIIVVFVYMSQQVAVQVFYSCLFVRLWLTYYDIRYNVLIGSNHWKRVIDENYNADTLWIVRFRSSLGNKNVLVKAMWILNVLFVIIDIILFSTDIANKGRTSYSSTFSICYFSIAVIGYWIFVTFVKRVLLKKVEFFDDLYILKEFMTFYKLVLVIMFIVIAYFLIFALILLDNDVTDVLWVITAHFVFQIWMIFCIGTIYVMSRWVFKQLSNDDTLQSEFSDIFDGDIELQLVRIGSTSPQTPNTSNPTFPSNSSQRVTLPMILSKNEYLSCFIQHLSMEFSMECLLALIEFIQFREYILTNSDFMSMNGSMGSRELNDIMLPSDVPKSSIVFNDAYNNKMRAQKLFNKYILVNSEHEINISAKNRNILTQQFEDDDNESFGDPFIFDKAGDDMLRLLAYSFNRFQSKPQFKKLQNIEANNIPSI